jgi:hypothetical protein
MRWIYLAVSILVAAARSYSRCRISRSSPCPFSDLMPHLPLALLVGVVLAAATGGSVFALFDHTKRRDAVLWARLLK